MHVTSLYRAYNTYIHQVVYETVIFSALRRLTFVYTLEIILLAYVFIILSNVHAMVTVQTRAVKLDLSVLAKFADLLWLAVIVHCCVCDF